MSDDFGLWEVFVSIFWFTLLMAWISLLFTIIGDIFRDRTLKGATKALWMLCILVFPWLGALVYILARGDSMNERRLQTYLDREEQMRAYIGASAGPNVAEELRGLSELRDSGVLTPEEYERAKLKILA